MKLHYRPTTDFGRCMGCGHRFVLNVRGFTFKPEMVKDNQELYTSREANWRHSPIRCTNKEGFAL